MACVIVEANGMEGDSSVEILGKKPSPPEHLFPECPLSLDSLRMSEDTAHLAIFSRKRLTCEILSPGVCAGVPSAFRAPHPPRLLCHSWQRRHCSPSCTQTRSHSDLEPCSESLRSRHHAGGRAGGASRTRDSLRQCFGQGPERPGQTGRDLIFSPQTSVRQILG